MPILAIENYDGMASRFAPEKLPVYLFQLLENLELTEVEGHLKKRKGYAKILPIDSDPGGLSNVVAMIEFTDRNGTRQLVVLDGTALEESVYSSGYGAMNALANDERISGATIALFHPDKDFRSELRSGVGNTASTQYPIWYGYIEEATRYQNGSPQISSGKYLCTQYDPTVRYRLLANNASDTVSGGVGYVSGKGLEVGTYIVYAAPILDGYQYGFPFTIGRHSLDDLSGAAGDGFITFNLSASAVAADFEPRITGFAIFVAKQSEYDPKTGLDHVAANFLEEIHLNDDSDFFYETTGDVNSTTANRINISGQGEELTFDPTNMFVTNVEGGETYRVTNVANDTPSAGEFQLTVTPNPTDANSSRTLRFFSRWYSGGTYYSFYDNNKKVLGAEMYDYLGIPSGDTGISDFRYKYCASSGNRFAAVGFPDRKFGHYSVANSPDIMPSQNFFAIRSEETGIVGIGNEEFLVFYKDSGDRIQIYGNQNAVPIQRYLTEGCSYHESITKVSDNEIYWMSYNGPMRWRGGNAEPIGDLLFDYWIDTLTDAQKEVCVSGYNKKKDQIWFSFPTYTTSPYTNGLVFVYDRRAKKRGKISPWYILRTDKKIETAILSEDGHLLTGADTEIHDWNNSSPTESFLTRQILKLIKNSVNYNDKLCLNRLVIDYNDAGSNNVTLNLYKDGSTTVDTALTLTGDSDREQMIADIADEFKIEITSASSNDDFTQRNILADYLEIMT